MSRFVAEVFEDYIRDRTVSEKDPARPTQHLVGIAHACLTWLAPYTNRPIQ
jgi:hypothetical protein